VGAWAHARRERQLTDSLPSPPPSHHAASLDALRTKRQRTVYRMTLVKGANMAPADIEDYAALVAHGRPDFIEVKGVTWCGTSPGSDLTMANVPWHREVREFCEAFAAKLAAMSGGGAGAPAVADGAPLDYGLAVEHEHSCFVLLAKHQFHMDGAWHTHIDYDRFHELMARYYASGGAERFSSMDYVARTPDWALFGAAERGFDPAEMRWRRGKDGGVAEITYQASESGCG
jgi:tRNA wybutosine-synthesizing protein 1